MSKKCSFESLPVGIVVMENTEVGNSLRDIEIETLI